MDLRLGKNAVFFMDTFCLSKRSAQMGKTSMIHLSMDMKIPPELMLVAIFMKM